MTIGEQSVDIYTKRKPYIRYRLKRSGKLARTDRVGIESMILIVVIELVVDEDWRFHQLRHLKGKRAIAVDRAHVVIARPYLDNLIG